MLIDVSVLLQVLSGRKRMELLPGDRDNLAIQTRGGPEKHEVTGWVLVSNIPATFQLCGIWGRETLCACLSEHQCDVTQELEAGSQGSYLWCHHQVNC